MKYIGLLESPRPLNTELMTLYAVMNGIPAKHIVRYAAVPKTASSGVDITITTGFTRHISSIVKGMDIAMKSVAVLPITSDAFFLSPAPTACPIFTVAPMASPTIITVSMCITWLPTETAVVPATPSNCPIMNRSAIP